MVERIIIADDHPLFRDALRRIVQRVISGPVVEVSNTSALIDELRLPSVPSAMFLDLVFPGFDGPATVRQLRQEFPNSAIIVISMTDEVQTAQQVMEAGANGFISKSVSPDAMMQNIRRIIDGEIIVCLDSPAAAATSQPSLNLLDVLTPRHVDVLVHIAQGRTNKEIARELSISPFTVRAHISTLFKILGVSTRSAASTLAVSRGLI